MRTFTSGFTAAKNKKSHEPITLLKISWPAIGAFPAKTLNLSDRAVTIGGVNWLPLVADWGAIGGVGLDTLLQNAGEEKAKVQLLNAPVDFGEGLQRFSDILFEYPPEAATGLLYQWFEGEGLAAADQTELLTARIVDPMEYDETFCAFHLVVESAHHGRIMVGNTLTLTDYPDLPETSVGRIKPIVIGQVEDVPGLSVRRVYTTRLTSVALPGATALDVASTTGFPVTGWVVINDDTIAYTGVTVTQFTGCTGINEFHYADDEVIESVSDHRYLLSDPAYSISGISNVKVAGELADGSSYSIDLAKGEVIFSAKPRKVVSVDTRFLQAQFDAEATGNTALDPLNATNPFSRTAFAKISQANRKLKLKQTTNMAALGEINKVLLRVEHFVEEKTPNDSIVARFEGLGDMGTLSAPADVDAANTTGDTDITHNHLDTLGFPVNIPNHLHTATSEADHVVIQGASSGPAGNLTITDLNDVGPYSIAVTFPAPPGSALKAEYKVSWRYRTVTFASGTPTLKFGTHVIGTFNGTRNDFDYTQTFTVSSGTGGNTWNITLNTGFMKFDLLSAERTVYYTPNPATLSNPLDTVKGGGVTQHGSSPALSATTEKSTNTVVNFFDISALVNRDWSWFTNRVVEIEYTGSSDGRTAYIIHTAFEIEYARRRLAATDEVTADVTGVVDDGTGTITGTPGAVIERPDHVFRWSIRNLLGLAASVIDDASFNQAGTEFANAITGGYQLAGVVQSKRLLDTLWRQWMKESRSHLFWDAAGKARLQFRPFNHSSVADGKEVKALTESMVRLDPESGAGRIRFQRTPSDRVVNHIELGYRRDWAAGHYGQIHVASDSDTISLFGKRERPGEFLFDWFRVNDMAQDLAQFYLAELKAPQTLVACKVFLDQMELERGDFVTVSHPLVTGASVLHGIVLPGSHRPGSGQARRMDGLDLMIRLFPSEHLRDLLSESAEATETSSLLATFDLDLPETVDVTDQAFEDEADGWGSQDWGTSGWGGLVPL